MNCWTLIDIQVTKAELTHAITYMLSLFFVKWVTTLAITKYNRSIPSMAPFARDISRPRLNAVALYAKLLALLTKL